MYRVLCKDAAAPALRAPWATGIPELWTLRLATSLFPGGVIPVANLAIKKVVPPERQGTGMGVTSSAVSAGFAAALGFWAPFLIPGVLLVASGAALCVLPLLGTRAKVVSDRQERGAEVPTQSAGRCQVRRRVGPNLPVALQDVGIKGVAHRGTTSLETSRAFLR